MARILIAHTLTFVILLSQVGLPLHMHYCKGMLESVSVFFSLGCDDHEEPSQVVIQRDCCQKDIISDCAAEQNRCCDDEVKLVTQDITSITHELNKWTDLQMVIQAAAWIHPALNVVTIGTGQLMTYRTDSGPPIYLRQHALIFYG
jgi:hypothetical protein